MEKKTPQLDGHKLMYHPEKVAQWLKGEIFPPIYVEIGPTSACNHRCNFCAFDYLKDRRTFMPKRTLLRILKEMADFGVKAVMFGGEGEPLMHPDLPEAIEKAHAYGLDMAITTNGVLFTPDKAKRIIPRIEWVKFSVDAGTADNYAKIHGTKPVDFERMLSNLKAACLIAKGHKANIGCQMCITDDNINDVEKLVKRIKGFGLDYFTMKPYVKHPDSLNRKHLTAKDYDKKLIRIASTYQSKDFHIIYRSLAFREVERDALDYEKCHGINFITLVDAHGNVIPCSVFYERPEFYYGNLHEKSFAEIWTSKRRFDVQEKVFTRGTGGCRNNCRLNFVNKYLNTVKKKDKHHINFI